MSSMIQILAGIAIVFFLPGYTFVSLLFPRRGELDPEYDVVYRVALGMGLSIVIAIIIGFALDAVSTEEHGYVTADWLWLLFLSVTGAFFLGGWIRGAYPWMGFLHPALYRNPPPRRIGGMRLPGHTNEHRASRLVMERERWLAEVKRCSSRLEGAGDGRAEYYRRRIAEAKGFLEEINSELETLREEVSSDDAG
jgi:MFS family permease